MELRERLLIGGRGRVGGPRQRHRLRSRRLHLDKDLTTAHNLAASIRAGSVWVNLA
jgi:hypothetical protein